jgi:hypothetical protein
LSKTNLKSLLDKQHSELALVIGNGIHRYNTSSATNSWESLLKTLGNKYLEHKYREIPKGISLTEFYDVLDLKSGSKGQRLQQDFCSPMLTWKPYAHHKKIVDWAKRFGCPLLTTNFDNVLGEAGGCNLYRAKRDGFTDYYPWENYYGNSAFSDPCSDFGIWHINGMQHYHRSIRLGLSHYMGSVERARNWIHKGKNKRLFSGESGKSWRGKNSWLQVLFNRPLLIFGLGLEENEVFLRWLLIERARYFRKFPSLKLEAWYVHTDEADGSGKLFFLQGVGVQPIRVAGYDEMYGDNTWV